MRRLCALILSLLAGGALAATIDEDVQHYLNVLQQGDPRFQANELENLSAMGLSDLRLFDPIEQRLLADVEAVRNIHMEKNRVAWYFRALGFSGQEKYRPTLARYNEDRTYRNYAIAAQRDLANYTKWNPVISSRATFDPKLSDNANRLLNMLRNDDPDLQRVAAKRAFLTHEPAPAVADQIAARLRAMYPKATDDESVETAGWFVNALSRVGTSDAHFALLREVAATAPSDKLKRRAQSVLERRR